MEKKQQVAAFAWEPAGDRFALVLGDVPKLEVTFYTMKVRAFNVLRSQLAPPGISVCVVYQWYTFHTRPSFIRFVFQGGAGKNELQELETLQDRPFNHIYWSPMGNICLLAAMGDDVGPHNGRLEVGCFYSCRLAVNKTVKQNSALERRFCVKYNSWQPDRALLSHQRSHRTSPGCKGVPDASVTVFCRINWSCRESAVLRRGEPVNSEADRALQV